MSGVAIDDLSHSWGTFALKNIDLSIAQGSYFVLLGPTGSGKTLLLEAIAGAYRPRRGNIIVNGKNVTGLPPEKRGISYAPQNYVLFENMSVQKNVEFGLHARGIPEEERRNRVKRLLELLGIAHLASRSTRNLSGGERQRVSLARALAIEPSAVLLDEPLSAVDAATKGSILDYLRRVHKETGVTVIHVTHDQLEAASVADRIGVIRNGEIVQAGAPADVLMRAANAYTVEQTENLILGNVVGKEFELTLVDIGGGKVIEAITDRSGSVALHIRPEDVIISKHEVESSARNRLTGKVVEVADFGATVRLRISAERQITASITKRSFHEMQLNIGSEVQAIFKATSVEVL